MFKLFKELKVEIDPNKIRTESLEIRTRRFEEKKKVSSNSKNFSVNFYDPVNSQMETELFLVECLIHY